MIYSNLELKEKLKDYLRSIVTQEEMKGVPLLQILQIGNDLASVKYIQLKQKIGKQIGIEVVFDSFDENTNVDSILSILIEKQHQYSLHSKQANSGLILQLPVAEKFLEIINQNTLWKPNLESIERSNNSYIDVDFLSPFQDQNWQNGFLPPTIQAIDLVLKDILWNDEPNRYQNDIFKFIDSKLDFSGKTVAIIGQGRLVGKFMVRYLLDRHATIISLNKDTINSQELVSKADIVISAAGSPELVKSDWLKDGVILIDAATSESDGGLVGDVDVLDLTQTKTIDKITLVKSPGGIGPITVLCLFYNLLQMKSIQN